MGQEPKRGIKQSSAPDVPPPLSPEEMAKAAEDFVAKYGAGKVKIGKAVTPRAPQAKAIKINSAKANGK